MRRTRTLEISGNGTSIKLYELEWLVEQLKGEDGELDIHVSIYEGDLREPDTITVRAVTAIVE